MNRQKALMKKYLSRPENQLCADCKRPSPTWASLNIGVFVCIKCSGCHREIGVHITKIKSVELDLWPSKSLTDFSKINNEIANAYWEYDLGNFDFQKIRDNEIRCLEFIRDKYEYKRWAKPNVPNPMSLVIQGRDLVKEFMNNGEAVKLYEKSGAPERERWIRHFNNNKNEKKGKSFGILDKKENNTNNNNHINNIVKNENGNNNENHQNMNQNKENNNQSEKKGFPFIKKKHNKNENNNESNTNTNTNNVVVDLLGFGTDDLNEQSVQNNNTNSNSDTNNGTSSGMSNIFPMDIFSFSQESNNNNDIKNINNNDNSANNKNLESNKPKSGFVFIKNKKKSANQNNNSANNNADINALFGNNNNIISNTNSNNVKPENNNHNNISAMNTSATNIISQNQNVSNNNSNKSNLDNNVINLFESEQLVDLFNIETPTSDAVLNLSKNLINIYSNEKEEEKNINQKNQNINNNSQVPNTNSNYNVLNMNYPNININNYYPNNGQDNKNKQMMNNSYGMNPMMGFNYPNQGGYMNNNFGFWYGYNMNMNPNYMNMGMGMNNPINTGFSYQNDFYNNSKIEKEKEEQKPILLNNNSFEIDLSRDLKKEKDDPFKNLVDFK